MCVCFNSGETIFCPHVGADKELAKQAFLPNLKEVSFLLFGRQEAVKDEKPTNEKPDSLKVKCDLD